MFKKCKCIKGDPIRGLIEGKEYFVDTDSFYYDCDGDLLGTIYPVSNVNKNLPEKGRFFFSFYNKHFIPQYPFI